MFCRLPALTRLHAEKDYVPASFEQVGAWQVPNGGRHLRLPSPVEDNDQPHA